jgi:curved DNA-binding protein CbpA
MGIKAFTDCYENLQISPNADMEMIERVFRLLAKRYHPDNKQTGNAENSTRLMMHTVCCLIRKNGRLMT